MAETKFTRQKSLGLHAPLLKPRLSRAVGLDTHASVTDVNDMHAKIAMGELEDAPSREAFNAEYGVRFLRHHTNNHPDKILEYLEHEVADYPVGIAFNAHGASVFAFPHVTQGLIMSLATSTIFLFSSVLLEECVMDTLTAVGNTVSQGLFFLLGPYIALCIARWWQSRMEHIGGMWGAAAELNTWAGIWFNSGSAADLAARALVMRYGLAAHTLLYKGARGEEALDEMVEKGLLMAHEAAILQPLPSKSQMVCAWMADFWNRALSPDQGGLGTTPIPHAAMQAPAVLKKVADCRGACGGALALVFTQLPFPYLHLLSMLVRFASIINAIVQGAHTGWLLTEPICLEGHAISTGHTMRYEWQEGCPPAIAAYSYVATVMILFGWLVSVLMYPVIYNGLFSIGVMLANPLGKDFINFAGSFYQHIMKAEMKGFYSCVDAVNLTPGHGDVWWAGIGQPGAGPSRGAR